MKINYQVDQWSGLTVIETDLDAPADERGRRSTDRLICMAATLADAQRIAVSLNDQSRKTWGM